jgi:hypothetical protein
MVQTMPSLLGMTDNDEGPKKGLWFRAVFLLRAVKTFFVQEMSAQFPELVGQQSAQGQGLEQGQQQQQGQQGQRDLLGTLCEGRVDGMTGDGGEQDGQGYHLPPGMVGDPMISDEFLQVIADEPWAADMWCDRF